LHGASHLWPAHPHVEFCSDFVLPFGLPFPGLTGRQFSLAPISSVAPCIWHSRPAIPIWTPKLDICHDTSPHPSPPLPSSVCHISPLVSCRVVSCSRVPASPLILPSYTARSVHIHASLYSPPRYGTVRYGTVHRKENVQNEPNGRIQVMRGRESSNSPAVAASSACAFVPTATASGTRVRASRRRKR